MSDFVHLHVHSEFSLLDGAAKLEKLVQKAKDLGYSALALTDHGAMYGAFKFYLKAKELGIKPIIGCEVYMAEKSRTDKQTRMGADQYHLILLAKDLIGYRNLMKLVSAAHLEGFHYRPRIDLNLLKKHSQGLIGLSACMQGIISQSLLHQEYKKAEKWTKDLQQTFPDGDFYIELQRHPKVPELDKLNQELVKLARKFGIGLVATNDVHYLDKEDAYAQEVLLCIQTRRTVIEKDRPVSMIDVPDYYLKSSEEMKGQFIDYPEAIANTVKIADKCNLEIPHGQWVLPLYEVPKGQTAETWLRKLTEDRLINRYPQPDDKINQRINYEIEIITKKGYATYFLIVQDFVNWAKTHGVIVGPGRGSAAGSIVAYILGITDLDPLMHNLPFERFLNPDRPTPPDIDIDFADDKRDLVVRYVMDKYGVDKVAQIITFGTMEARMVVRDVSRALGWSYTQGDRIAKLIPQGKQGFNLSLEGALQESPELSHLYKTDEKVRNLLDISKKLEGLVRHSSVHADGVVVADQKLTYYTPIQTEARGGKTITQDDMYCLDLNAVSDNKAIGLLKFDFLGLRNLSILGKALSYVKQNHHRDINLSKLSLVDEATYQLIAMGYTIGIFQLESRGMQRLAKDIKPNQFTDISAMVALFRPGPMALIPQFIDGKKNPAHIRYLHSDLKPILAETYGILVYQEQVTEIAHKIAGFTMTEADLLRMAMGKKKKELMKKGQVKFIKGCLAKGYSRKMAEQLFEFIEKFAAYGFNKAHSASYATISYWTAYVKAHYPVEFMTALLTAELEHATGTAREEKIVQILDECKRMGINVLPPDINRSLIDFAIEGKDIRFGLGGIKNIGSAALETILKARKKKLFDAFKDFLLRVDLRKVNKKTVESLVYAGAFDQFGKRAQLLLYYSQIVKEIAKQKSNAEEGQYGLFAKTDFQSQDISDRLPEVAEFAEDELIGYEREAIGFYLSANPFNKYLPILKQKKAKAIIDLEQYKNKKIIVGGVVKSVKKIKTKKNNDEMAFATLTDLTAEIEIVIFPKLFSRSRQLWVTNQMILIKGLVQEKDRDLVIIVDEAISLRAYEK